MTMLWQKLNQHFLHQRVFPTKKKENPVVQRVEGEVLHKKKKGKRKRKRKASSSYSSSSLSVTHKKLKQPKKLPKDGKVR